MQAKSISYKTTIVGIRKVVLTGKVLYDPDLEAYTVGGDSVDQWLERISEKQSDAYVVLTIKVHDGNPDDENIIKAVADLFPIEDKHND